MITQAELDNELRLFETGRQLRAVVNTSAWEIVIDTLKSYKDQAIEDLVNLVPGDPTVPTAHAAASALSQQFINFQRDINNALDFAANPSSDLQDYLAGVRQDSDVQKATTPSMSR